ncbi:MAG: radical SAM family heme chaperone HemW [Nitrospirae bacterium]|nr:radical SAM family heme chaperone HemW [Nitrospirota bacterium]
MGLSLYIHIPFCLRRCNYCDFVSGVYTPSEADVYLDALKKEINSLPVLAREERPFDTLYIGGGTPTVLSGEEIGGLVMTALNTLHFVKNPEITVEVNPGTVDREKLKTMKDSGVNRLSIGVQSFNDAELKTLGRIHNSEDACFAIELAKDSGFKNISLDLIYGIPGQDLQSWKESLKRAVNLSPVHISTYELTLEEGTELHKAVRAGALILPEEKEVIEMYEFAIAYLNDCGFVHYEISNFALPDYFCRHNVNYWDRGEYYGAGLGAHSFIDGRRFYNTKDMKVYVNSISEGFEDITEEKALAEAIFLGLRKTDGINLPDFQIRYGKNFLELYAKEIKELCESGLLEFKDNNLKLTLKGLLLSNEVFAKFV